MTLIDPFQRNIHYLRVSITDRCNLRCMYCMAESFVPVFHQNILRYEEILRLIQIGITLGITKVRITGGEPLIRRDVVQFLQAVGRLKGLKDISLTTNGVLLKRYVKDIYDSGIHRLNISLDTLNEEKYIKITKYNAFTQVWEGMMQSHEIGMSPIKLNMVVMKGVNDDEIIDFAKLSFRYPFHIRFIEYMPIGTCPIGSAAFLGSCEILNRIRCMGRLIPLEKENPSDASQPYQLEGAVGTIGLISPLTHQFCAQCSRLRLTANGFLRPCLLSDQQYDLQTPMRSGATDAEIREIIQTAVSNKPFHHDIFNNIQVVSQMASIGG